ncbi:MAG TPA: TfoX/Sxy family protein [Planctomycetota bacterium]|nr:TfoX/Sxy family protein [Planctomycetota bacterium]
MRDASFRDFVLDQLEGLDGVEARAMFGGYGLYLGEEFFGMVWKGRAWFRTDERSRAEYRALGSEPIPFGKDYEQNRYWSVPEDVLEDGPRLRAWALAAASTPRSTSKRKRHKPKAPRAR